MRMQIFFMILWSFILRPIPYKKIGSGAAYTIILCTTMYFTFNLSGNLVENGVILITYTGE